MFRTKTFLVEGMKKMKITVITVGKLKEKYLKDAIAEYAKRLSKYCKLEKWPMKKLPIRPAG